MTPGAERLGEQQHVARPGAARWSRTDPGDVAGDRVAELDFRILDGVPAEQRDARLAQRLEAAGKDRRSTARSAVLRKPGNGQRRQRPAAHRIDVAQRVGGGDLAVDERDRRRSA